jgi:hypothetical protein
MYASRSANEINVRRPALRAVKSPRFSASYIALLDKPVAFTASGMVTAIGVCITGFPQSPGEIARTLWENQMIKYFFQSKWRNWKIVRSLTGAAQKSSYQLCSYETQVG